MLRTIGLMSGTSLDGVDAAYLETDGEVIARFGPRQTLPYDPSLRRALRALLDRAESLTPDDPALLDATRRLTERHGKGTLLVGGLGDEFKWLTRPRRHVALDAKWQAVDLRHRAWRGRLEAKVVCVCN